MATFLTLPTHLVVNFLVPFFYWLVLLPPNEWFIIDSTGNWSWASRNATTLTRNEPYASVLRGVNMVYLERFVVRKFECPFSKTCWNIYESAYVRLNSELNHLLPEHGERTTIRTTQAHFVSVKIHSVHHMGDLCVALNEYANLFSCH